MWAGYRSARGTCAPAIQSESGTVNRKSQIANGARGMNCVNVILLLVAAAYTIARPSDLSARPSIDERQEVRDVIKLPTHHLYPSDFILPRILIPRYLDYGDNQRGPVPIPISDNDWLSKEIDHISQMEEDSEAINNYDSDISPWLGRDRYPHRFHNEPKFQNIPYSPPYNPNIRHMEPLPQLSILPSDTSMHQPLKSPWMERAIHQTNYNSPIIEYKPVTQASHNSKIMKRPPAKLLKQKQREAFALTPLDKGFFENVKEENSTYMTKEEVRAAMEMQPPRKTRQNPNLSKTKTLVAENLDRLRTGLANKDYRMPVSLLPVNLDFLKINKLDDEEERSHEEDSTDRPRHIHVLETSTADQQQSMYGTTIVAAMGVALTMAIVVFAFGWYTLSKKAKAAADVDYPAYGVTGPTVDNSGDRKLAHSAHMYHYQHQKQQIIAMERNCMERNGSISDPESEEENEEGDYTVYECPGFATTGDMEVKNPLFSDDPTPATPGRCEIVKPQPKE